MPHEHYSPPIFPIFVKRNKIQITTKDFSYPKPRHLRYQAPMPTPHNFLKNLTQFMSNSRQVQTKKCPDKPGEDEFASIKEKQ